MPDEQHQTTTQVPQDRMHSTSTMDDGTEDKQKTQDVSHTSQSNAVNEGNVQYPPPAQAALVMIAILMALFLTALVSQLHPTTYSKIKSVEY